MADAVFDYFRRGGSDTETRHVFTNRVLERRHFWDALEAHERRCEGTVDLDVNASRHHVVNFYGVGGIGKSSLLRDLENELRSSDTPAATAIIDFADASTVDVEAMILRIRTAVGGLGIRCSAFDFALSYYWSIVHPGTTLEAYTKSSSLLARVGERVGLSSDVESSVMDVMSSIVSASSLVHGSTRLAMTVKELVSKRSQGKHAIANCAALPSFLDAGTVATAFNYATALLAWDVAQAGNPRVVFFLDTFEELTARGRSTENAVQRICYLFPNALFVIAGRDRIDWAKESLLGSLDYVGPHAWPDLVRPGSEGLGAGMPMLVGELSETDADDYLRSRLVRDREPAIPADVRLQIVQAAEGWPLYLDIAVGQYSEALSVGSTDTIDFGASFPALVARIMTDLDHEERRVLRAAALFTSFDEELVHAAAGGVSRASVRRLLERSFVKRTGPADWPYTLHSALRSALLADDNDDAWDEADWRLAGQRTLSALDDRRSMTGSRGELADCLDLGLRLAHRFRLDVPWLAVLGRHLATRGSIRSLPRLDGARTSAQDLAVLLRVVSERRDQSYEAQVNALEAVLPLAADPVDIFWVRMLQANALLSAGKILEAEELYLAILHDAPSSPLLADTKTMYALTLLKRGAFHDLDSFARDNAQEVNSSRLRGDIARFHGDWDEARALYARGLDEAVRRQDRGLEQLFRSELALVDGWSGDEDPERWFAPTDVVEETWSRVTRFIASGLFEGSRDLSRAIAALDSAAVNAETFGFHEGLADVTVARCFVLSLHGRHDAASQARRELEAYVETSGTYRSWLDVTDFWHAEPAAAAPQTQWIGGAEAAAHRWHRTFLGRVVTRSTVPDAQDG